MGKMKNSSPKMANSVSITGVIVLTGIGIGIISPVIVPYAITVGLIGCMGMFAKSVTKNEKAIDADEIISPYHKRRNSTSNEVYDMPPEEYEDYDMQREKQIRLAQEKEKKLQQQLSETRKAIRTMKDSTR